MHASSLVVLSGLLKNISAKDKISLLEPLSSTVKNDLENAYTPKTEISYKNFTDKEILSDIHYSWFIPYLENFSKEELSYILSAFNEKTKIQLEKYFEVSSSVNLKEIANDFYGSYLNNLILDAEASILPKKYLPESELSPLLNLSKNEIIKLIDLLPIFDLAIEIHKIVDNSTLNKIEKFLSPEKKKLLKKLSFYKQSFKFPSLALEKTETEEEFNLVLHKRGLNIFAKALCNEHKSFIWYICHKLDAGRGKTLLKLCREKTKKEVTKTITFNIIDVLPIIRNNIK